MLARSAAVTAGPAAATASIASRMVCASAGLASICMTIPAVSHPTAGSVSHPLGLLDPIRPLAVVGIEQLLAQPDRFRRDLDQLVVGDIGERLLQCHLDRRGQAHGLVLGV